LSDNQVEQTNFDRVREKGGSEGIIFCYAFDSGKTLCGIIEQIHNSFFPDDTKQKAKAAQQPPDAKKQKVATPEDFTTDKKKFLAATQQPLQDKDIEPVEAKPPKASRHNKPLVAAPVQPPKEEDKNFKPLVTKTTKASYNKPLVAVPNQPPKDKSIPATKSLDPPSEWWRPSKLLSLFQTLPK
jgi:hypothetical protein